MARLSNVVLHPYPESHHPVVEWLVKNKQIDDLLARFLIDEHDLVAANSDSDRLNSGDASARRSRGIGADDRAAEAGVFDGFNAHRLLPGAPALLVFEDPADSPNPVLSELLERIARRDGRPRTLVVIRGSVAAAFLREIEDPGGSFEEFVEALRCRLAASAAGDVTTFGRGLGGYSALVFGVLLRARRIVTVEPVAHLIAEELARYCDRRWERVLPALPDPELARRL